MFAIGVMTLAIAFLLGAIMGRVLTPTGGGGPEADAAVSFADAPMTSLRLPTGSRLIEQAISADRVTLLIETADGERRVLTAPLSGYEGPVQLILSQ